MAAGGVPLKGGPILTRRKHCVTKESPLLENFKKKMNIDSQRMYFMVILYVGYQFLMARVKVFIVRMFLNIYH